MVERQPLTLDAKTIALVSEVLEAAWDSIPPPQKATIQKSTLAIRILKSSNQGERDRKRLLDAALDLAA